jgi:CRP/FNR family cyclic AMP-dependent transcriptional regulator
MAMRKLDELLADVPAFAGMDPASLELIAGCGVNRVFQPGELLFREGDPADTFHVVREGTVAIEVYVPPRGPMTIETLHDGDLLGWSWLVPPYRLQFDARALDTVHALTFDGACLRGKCEEDPALGYDLLKRFTAVIVERLQATRLRLLDVYGRAATA